MPPRHHRDLALRSSLAGACLSCALGAPPAAAQDEPVWIASLTGSGVFADEDAPGAESAGGSFALERAVGSTAFGVAVGASDREVQPNGAIAPSDAQSLFGAAWIVAPLGEADLTLSLDLARETFDPVSFETNAGTAEADGESDFFSIGAALGRTFGDGAAHWRPFASVAWSQVETTIDISPARQALADISAEVTDEGWTASAGALVAYDLAASFSVSASAAYVVAETEAATWSSMRGMGGPITTGDENGAEWGEAGVGASWSRGRTAVGLDLLGTVGRAEDLVTASATISRSF